MIQSKGLGTNGLIRTTRDLWSHPKDSGLMVPSEELGTNGPIRGTLDERLPVRKLRSFAGLFKGGLKCVYS